MLEAVDAILSFTEGHDRGSFVDDLRTVYAVRAGFAILGEAARDVPDRVREAMPHIPWDEIRKFRNFVVHVYDQVDPGRLYDTVIDELPGLQDDLKAAIQAR